MEKGYEKLEIFKLSYELAVKSIPANIVEGYCLRRHKNEYLQYLHRAFGSCEKTNYHLGKMIFRFIESVSIHHLSPSYIKESEIEYET